MKLRDRNGNSLTVRQRLDRPALMELVKQTVALTGMKQREIMEETGTNQGHISHAMNDPALKYDFARIKLCEWWWRITIEQITEIRKRSDQEPIIDVRFEIVSNGREEAEISSE